ncbi:hypothetical protein FB45DRAFT_750967 [Roridomyces roridus]|uniref:Lipid droplet-associated perilipin protein n=1 Tax=Roridomyces roridus TaxID=1738132 RepID=A0AAD7BN81_9AGAR|nr:hypothetical protein FB45DRAFT_750967 [Roridomyces roridus]
MPSKQADSDITIVNRVASIPLIAYAIQTVGSALETNAYTSSPYSAAKGLSVSVYKYAEPVQNRLGPYLKIADGYANQAVDVVQKTYPYPFEAQPEDVATYVRQRRDSAVQFVEERRLHTGKVIDENVRTPALNAAAGIDQRFTPLVDYLESTASARLQTCSAPVETQYQYQRVYILSRNVTGQLYDYSNQTLIVQRASGLADSIVAIATSANKSIHSLSDSLIAELGRLQTSLANTGASVQHSTTVAGRQLADTITTLHAISVQRDLPLNEKGARIRAEIEDRVRPLLNHMRTAPPPPTANGNGHVE